MLRRRVAATVEAARSRFRQSIVGVGVLLAVAGAIGISTAHTAELAFAFCFSVVYPVLGCAAFK